MHEWMVYEYREMGILSELVLGTALSNVFLRIYRYLWFSVIPNFCWWKVQATVLYSNVLFVLTAVILNFEGLGRATSIH